MSQQSSGFQPTMVDDRSIQLVADYVKGQRTPSLAMTKRGNKPALVAYMNDDQKSKIDVRLPAPGFWAVIEAVKNALRAKDESNNIRFTIEKPGGKNPDGSFSRPEPQAIVSVGRDPKSNRIFIGLTDATNETLRKQFFFKMPRYMKLSDGKGQPIDPVTESEMAAAAWVSMIPALMGQVLVKDYKDFRQGFGGGNRQQSGSNQNYNNQNKSSQSSGGGNESDATQFVDDDFSF